MESSTVTGLVALLGFATYRITRGVWIRKKIPGWISRGAIIVDVRTAAEFQNASNPKSKNIPLDRLEAAASGLDPRQPVIVCCASGMRSAAAKAILKAKGFAEVLNAGAWTQTLLLLLTLVATPALAEPEWEKLSEEDGITSYRKIIPGSPIVAIKGETVLDEGMAKVVGVLENVEREVEWMADLAESYNIEKITESDRWEYNRTKTPWPLKDRDFVIHTLTTLERKPEPVLTIRMFSGKNPKKPEVSGAVRGELIDSRFVLSSIGPRQTRFICEIQADPKGIIPKWVVNLFQKSWPQTTIQGLRKQLQKSDIRENETLKKILNPT